MQFIILSDNSGVGFGVASPCERLPGQTRASGPRGRAPRRARDGHARDRVHVTLNLALAMVVLIQFSLLMYQPIQSDP